MTESDRPRWFTEFDADHSAWYIDRFRRKAAAGDDLDGEARLVDALLARGSRVLDAGCGPGRVGAALHELGHVVVGVDVDPALIAAARADHPGPRWLVADLVGLGLGEPALDEPAFDEPNFDAAVLAGNVLVYVRPGSERDVLARVAAQVRPDGVVITGFNVEREYRLETFDRDCAAVGLVLEHRFATWDLRPWRADADWAVTVLRRPAA
jgi:SAM-dependent methyltransferase